MSTVLETTVGVLVPLERYNVITLFEKVAQVIPSATFIVVVAEGRKLGLHISPATTIDTIIQCSVLLLDRKSVV